MEQHTIPELLQQSEQLLNEWKVITSLLIDLDLENKPKRQTKKRAKELLNRLEKLQDDILKTQLDMLDYLDNDNSYIKKIYDELDVVYDQLRESIKQMEECLVVDELLSDMRQSQMLGRQPVYGNDLYDYKIRQAIATSKQTDLVFQMIGMSVWIFVSYMFGPVIVYGLIDDILPYDILGSSSLCDLIASLGGIVCGILCFVTPLIFVRKKNVKRAEFAKHAYTQSTIFRAKLIKVVQETPTNFYVHYEDDKGKKRISPISEEMRRSLCRNGGAKYINVLKYPKYEGGYGYMALDPNDFENRSSIQIAN